MDWLINFTANYPLLVIIIISAAITFLVTYLYKILMNKEEYDKLKARQKEIQKRLKEKLGREELTRLQEELASLSMKMLKMSFKPMLFTFIPLLIVFYLVGKLYIKAGVGNIIAWGIKLPLVGTGAGWLLSYIIFSFIFSLIFRKIFKI